MPWNNNGSDDGSGGGSGGPSPWGTPGGRPGGRPGGPRGPGGPTPPDMEEVIARLQGFLRGMLPPGLRRPAWPRAPRGPGGPRGTFSGGRGLFADGGGAARPLAGERLLPRRARRAGRGDAFRRL